MEHQVTTAVGAPPEDVWRLFVDVERWPQMTKSLREVRRLDSGPFRVGSQAVIKQPGLLRARWEVTELEPGLSFTWQTTSGGVTGVGGHVVTADGPGSVITLTLRLQGPLAGLIAPVVGRRARRYLAMEMEGFRRTAESQSAEA
jgi:uncharacterized membrane protein